jgi:AraC-like DNA-binding protein
MQNLYLISISLALFFLALLVSKKGKRLHDFLLICWFSLVLVNLYGFYLESQRIWNFVIELSSSVVFLHGVLLWFYGQMLVKSRFVFTAGMLLHFVPFLVYLGLVFPFLISGKIAPMPQSLRELLMVAKIVSLSVYLILIARDIRRHRRNITNKFSSLDEINLNWLRFIASCLLILILVGIVSQGLKLLGVPMFVLNDDALLNVLISVVIIVVGYFGFRQTSVFQDNLAGDLTTKRKYDKSALPVEFINGQFEKLQKLLEERKIYRDPNISLDTLAEALGQTSNNTSQIINSKGVSFFDLINQYRIAEIKLRLQRGDAKRQTLESIAAECGFSSKASFYRIFRKMTGWTPGEYVNAPSNECQPSR